MPASDVKTDTRTWAPHPGPQTEAFRYFIIDEILYGGAKGGGKTDWLLFDFLEPSLIDNSAYRGIIFRRTFPRLREIIDRSFQWFRTLANFNKQDRCWEWPSGAKLFFGHCQYEESKYDYQGHEYQYMGFDQIEEFTQTQYEFLKAQARTSDHRLPVRVRSTANPGNVGHLWVKRRFIDNRRPMQVYKDRHGLTSIFIPAKIYDNPSLMINDPMYVKRLESLPEQDRKALLEGDWNIFAGQYFKEWNPTVNVVDPFFIPGSWKRFISGDYGHKKPSSVGWYAVRPEGGVVRYREIYKEGLHYDTLTRMMCELSAEERISYAVFDPAIFGDKQHHSKDKDFREGKSGAEVMQETIRAWFEKNGNPQDSFLVTRADNRRIEGWMALKKSLRIKNDGTADFQVFSSCVDFITTFPANVHDDKNPEDLNSDGEDHCLSGETIIDTIDGGYKIKDLVGEEGFVYTPRGLMPFKNVRKTGNLMTYRIRIGNKNIFATEEHKFFTKKGWVKVKDLNSEDFILDIRPLMLIYFVTWKLKLYQIQSKNLIKNVSTFAGDIFKNVEGVCTELFGNISMVLSQRICMSTISTGTEKIIPYRTFASSKEKNICRGICRAEREKKNLGDILRSQENMLFNGINQKPEGHGTRILQNKTGLTGNIIRNFVTNAAKNIKLRCQQFLNFAIQTAKQKIFVPVEEIIPHKIEDVFDLEVPNVHCFSVGGGVIVHNSADEARYAIMSRPPATDLTVQENLSTLSPWYKAQELKRRREEILH